MAISILVEALLPSGVAVQGKGGGGNGKPENVKEWLRNKLKALAWLLRRLGAKAAEALPCIIQVIISWNLNRAKGSGLGIVKLMGIGHRCQRVALYIHGYEKVCHFHNGNDIQFSKYHKTPPIPTMLKVINANPSSCRSLLKV